MCKLIILRGNSGSGKTTVAKALQNRLGKNTMLISQDVIRRDMLKVRDGENNKAIPLMKELLNYGFQHSEIIILEGIMYSAWYQPLFELANQLFKDNIFAYYFDLPFKETLIRHQSKPNCRDFGEEAMRSWWKEKDYSNVLDEMSITKDIPFDSIVEDIIYAVSHH